MKRTVKVKVRPKRMTRKEKRAAKYAAKLNEQLILCQQAAAFHKAYLEIEYGVEEAMFNAIQARLAALRPEVETVITTEETVEDIQDNFDEDFGEEEAAIEF